MDPGCAPQRVFPTHPLDQITQATIDLRPPCPILGFPTPEHFEASAMPTQNGLRLHHLDRTNEARPEPGHQYEQYAIATAQSKTRWRSPQSDGKLMAEKQILSFKPAARFEQVGYKHSERVQDCRHRPQ
jgi:hypothetical protein